VLKRKNSSKKVKAQLTYLPGKHRVRLDPKGNLARKATYKVLVKGTIKDLAGNAFDASPKAGVQHLRWKFTTR
jgi:hypothetical protein